MGSVETVGSVEDADNVGVAGSFGAAYSTGAWGLVEDTGGADEIGGRSGADTVNGAYPGGVVPWSTLVDDPAKAGGFETVYGAGAGTEPSGRLGPAVSELPPLPPTPVGGFAGIFCSAVEDVSLPDGEGDDGFSSTMVPTFGAGSSGFPGTGT